MFYSQCHEIQMERVATQILGLTNYIPPVYDPAFGLFSTVKDPDESGTLILDVDELPGPDQFH